MKDLIDFPLLIAKFIFGSFFNDKKFCSVKESNLKIILITEEIRVEYNKWGIW